MCTFLVRFRYQLDDDPVVSKHVAKKMFHKVVFLTIHLFTSYLHNIYFAQFSKMCVSCVLHISFHSSQFEHNGCIKPKTIVMPVGPKCIIRISEHFVRFRNFEKYRL